MLSICAREIQMQDEKHIDSSISLISYALYSSNIDRAYEFLAYVSDKQKETWLILLSINILSIILYAKCWVPRPPSTQINYL